MGKRIRFVSGTALLAAACVLPGSATAQSPNLTIGKRHWLASRYGEALPPLTAFRVERYGRTAEVDYMLGTSGCRTGRREWGARVLNFVLYSYPLTAPSRATVAAERDRCRRGGVLGPLAADARRAIGTAIVAGAAARGKIYNFGNRSVAAYPARRTRELTPTELESRLVPIGQSSRITEVLESFAVPNSRVMVVGRYAFVTTAGQSDDELNRLRAQLDRFVDFLASEYELVVPDRYITIYLLPTISAVQQVAARVHGLDVSPSTLGYGFQDDLSAVGLVSRTESGTLLHELFHLLVRASFGDIPQWLDEGVAALYEVADERSGRFVGLPNWRGRVLQQRWTTRPPLLDVISSPWFAFDQVEAAQEEYALPLERMAEHLATARYFVLYLQERGTLGRVFRAFRTRDPGASDDPGQAAVALVERELGPIANLQADYDRWLEGVVREPRRSNAGAAAQTLPDDE